MINSPPKDIGDLMSRFGSQRAFAEAIPVAYEAAQKWAQNNRIPSTYLASVVRAARSRRIRGVTAQWIIDHHDKRKDP